MTHAESAQVPHTSSSESTLRIGVILPEVLGTYGDTGNAVVLAERARRRGIAAEIIHIGIDDAVPDSLDIYTMGGGEDIAQEIAASKLRNDSGLVRALNAGRPLLAICASLQVLGHWYEDARGQQVSGLGLLDATTRPQGARSIGELVCEPALEGLTELLTGFENHGGGTTLGPDARPLGRVRFGNGNTTLDIEGATQEGAVQGSIIATYMHGPVLARNPQLADLLLARAMGVELAALAPVEIPGVKQLRAERLAVARS
ncbi:type 1 glutamine amidotransferase [Schaalia canis]|uniref:Lipid II isoglutaminyl synthase (glutamine-hydrolyzing) subunit GatD n=1 Tax=Schaalia canis TaxID=100469 RepID=A0A3P1SDA6_9ACTO|nr:glutamine amidotransferase [Schaalia canis]RRC95026.1 glutamine amidotransferase [Schaalia canis]